MKVNNLRKKIFFRHSGVNLKLGCDIHYLINFSIKGLVHDAIACASFLKFHPSILKYNIYGMDQTIVEQSHEILTKEEKIQQRHSVEITNTSNYLNARPSTLEALTKSGYCCVHYRKQRGKAREV